MLQDGLANRGVGALDVQTKEEKEAAAGFYEAMGNAFCSPEQIARVLAHE